MFERFIKMFYSTAFLFNIGQRQQILNVKNNYTLCVHLVHKSLNISCGLKCFKHKLYRKIKHIW